MLAKGCRVLQQLRHPLACVVNSAQLSTCQPQVLVEPLGEQHEGISVLALNRPQSRNALGMHLISELQDAVNTLRQERTTRCVLLKSNVQGIFCAGADLKERATMTQQEAAEFVTTLRAAFTAVQELPMPTVALVEGPALGGGAELALACDLRVAGPGAVFAFPETRLGIIPGAGGTQRLPRLVGASRAKALIFTGRRVGAAEALAMGLVDELGAAVAGPVDPPPASPGAACPNASSAYQRALQLAKEIAGGAPLALRQAKAAISMGQEMDLQTGLRIEGACYAQLLPTADRLEGLRAFAEKRAPRYTGGSISKYYESFGGSAGLEAGPELHWPAASVLSPAA